jgi:hypothetical protein
MPSSAWVRLAVVIVCSLGIGTTASALVQGGDASAAGTSIGLSGVLDIDTGLVPAVSVSSPPPGSDDQTLFDLGGLPLVASGTATVSASSDVDGLAGTRSASGAALIADLELDLSILLTSVLSVGSGEISSSAGVTGDFGALGATGTSSFGGTSITVNNVTFTLDPAYAPNTVVFDDGFVLVMANEQIFAGDGAAARGITVNALRISLNVLGVSGDIVLAQSQAALAAVPEPGTGLLLGVGLAALARTGRRRR